jgi:hypothetical protein
MGGAGMSSDEYDRTMEWLDSIDPADVRAVKYRADDGHQHAWKAARIPGPIFCIYCGAAHPSNDEHPEAHPDYVARSRQAAVDRRLRERDELAALIRDLILAEQWGSESEPVEFCDLTAEQVATHCEVSYGQLADAVLAAGWRKPELVHPVPNVDTVTEHPFGSDHDPDQHDWVQQGDQAWLCPPCGARKWVT